MKKEYRQPWEIRLVAWIYLALATPAFVVLFWEFSQGRVEDKSAIIFIPLLFMPFYIGAIWLLWHFRGKFVLSNEGIMLQQFGKQTFLRYQDIFSIEERDSQLIPYLLLVTPEASLSISFKVSHFSDLYANLRRRVSAMRNAEAETLPLNLGFRPGYVRQSAAVLTVYAIFTGTLSAGASFEQSWSIEKFLIPWGIFISIALFLVWLNERTSPYRVEINRETIEARYLFRKTRRFKTSEITRIERERQVRHIRYGAKMIVDPVVITFSNRERLQLEEDRIWTFGYSPDRLLTILMRQLSNQP